MNTEHRSWFRHNLQEEPIPRPGRNTDRLQAGMRCEGCTGDRCEDALDRCLELDNRCEGCRLTSGSVRILVEATDESEDEASNGGRDPSDSGGLSGKAASEEEILEAFKVSVTVRRGRFDVCLRAAFVLQCLLRGLQCGEIVAAPRSSTRTATVSSRLLSCDTS